MRLEVWRDATGWAAGDGRTVTLRAVPYDQPALVRDVRDGVPTDPYREGWRFGCFRNVVRAAHRVPLLIGNHALRVSNPQADVGKGVDFVERQDGLVVTFRVDETPGGDQALFKIKDGQWTHASIGAVVLKTETDADGTVWRTLAHLDHVVLTDSPAFEQAEVLSVRQSAPISATPLLDRWRAKYLPS